MDDENKLREVDWRVSASLAPDRTVAARVLATALTAGESPGSWRRPLATLVVAGALATLAAGIYLKRPVAGTGITITGEGSSIVVQRADGTRLLLAGDDKPPLSQGGYAIAVHMGDSR